MDAAERRIHDLDDDRPTTDLPADADGLRGTRDVTLLRTGAVGIALLGDSMLVRQGLGATLSAHPLMRLVESRRTALIDLLLVDPWRCGIRTAQEMATVKTRLNPRQVACFSWKSPTAARRSAAGLGFDHFVWKEATSRELLDSLALAAGVEPLDLTPDSPDDPSLLAHGGSCGHTPPGTEAANLPGPQLSTRELQLLQLIMAGIGNQEISARLYLSLNTVKSYIRHLYGKIHVANRAQAVRWGYEHRAWVESRRDSAWNRLPCPSDDGPVDR